MMLDDVIWCYMMLYIYEELYDDEFMQILPSPCIHVWENKCESSRVGPMISSRWFGTWWTVSIEQLKHAWVFCPSTLLNCKKSPSSTSEKVPCENCVCVFVSIQVQFPCEKTWGGPRLFLFFPGWWFGTCFYFPFHIWDVILPIDFHIFQNGYCTTNQFPVGFSTVLVFLRFSSGCVPWKIASKRSSKECPELNLQDLQVLGVRGDQVGV